MKKSYSAVIVSMDVDKTLLRVKVLSESETEARRILEQQYGDTASHALLEEEVKPPQRPRRSP